MKIYIYFFTACVLCNSCKETIHHKKGNPIIIGDQTSIITETDSTKLENYTEDISLVGKKNTSDKAIASMMIKVDSLQAKKNIMENNNVEIKGFSIIDNDVVITFDKLQIKNKVENSKATSITLTADATTQTNNMLLQIDNLNNAVIQQRISTKLYINDSNKFLMLNELGTYTSAWFTIANSKNKFESLGKNACLFKTLDNTQIKNAMTTELKKNNFSTADIASWEESIKEVATYHDSPCNVFPISIEYKISGTVSNKPYTKNIRIEIER